jgi:hypothetical protein
MVGSDRTHMSENGRVTHCRPQGRTNKGAVGRKRALRMVTQLALEAWRLPTGAVDL